MGYTHYWEVKTGGNEIQYREALKAIRKLVKANSNILANWEGKEGTKPKLTKGIRFNGIGEQSHETFSLPATLAELQNEGFNFCKTNRKTYDIIVVAALELLKYHLKTSIKVSSDGNTEDLSEGKKLAKQFIKE